MTQEDISDIINKINNGEQITGEEFKLLTKETDWNEFYTKTLTQIGEAADRHHLAQCRSYAKGISRYIR
ncbi:hypothetical protein GF361_01480 [Candidatus Woesearchaeota archaeon]|nr:hypothetical protein [Candidatus Woesearchaeota archaeon]